MQHKLKEGFINEYNAEKCQCVASKGAKLKHCERRLAVIGLTKLLFQEYVYSPLSVYETGSFQTHFIGKKALGDAKSVCNKSAVSKSRLTHHSLQR